MCVVASESTPCTFVEVSGGPRADDDEHVGVGDESGGERAESNCAAADSADDALAASVDDDEARHGVVVPVHVVDAHHQQGDRIAAVCHRCRTTVSRHYAQNESSSVIQRVLATDERTSSHGPVSVCLSVSVCLYATGAVRQSRAATHRTRVPA